METHNENFLILAVFLERIYYRVDWIYCCMGFIVAWGLIT